MISHPKLYSKEKWLPEPYTEEISAARSKGPPLLNLLCGPVLQPHHWPLLSTCKLGIWERAWPKRTPMAFFESWFTCKGEKKKEEKAPFDRYYWPPCPRTGLLGDIFIHPSPCSLKYNVGHVRTVALSLECCVCCHYYIGILWNDSRLQLVGGSDATKWVLFELCMQKL